MSSEWGAVYGVSGNMLNCHSQWVKMSNLKGVHAFIFNAIYFGATI